MTEVCDSPVDQAMPCQRVVKVLNSGRSTSNHFMSLRLQIISLLLSGESEFVADVPIVARAVISTGITDDEEVSG